RIGDLEGAIADYEKAIELDPEDAVAYNNKGLVEEKLGYRDQSKKSFEKADELVGYEPNRIERDNVVQNTSTPSDKAEIQQAETGEKKDSSKKINISTYFKTLVEVLTNKNTQKEFWAFLKGGLRNPKN
ncbi:MAG: tetratricopeptide repeat protein, partial [Cyclobacteriaceae bacterium]|nr:tetratricopeptide repeat protein [Cyclobacteriaceae bacterium]